MILKQQKLANLRIFPHSTYVLKIGLWHLNHQVIYAHAYHFKTKINHLSLLNLPWFIFENVHVFCLIQIITQNQFYFLLYIFRFFSVGYPHRAFIFKKDYQCRPPNNLLVNIFAKMIFNFSGRKSFTAMTVLIAHWLWATCVPHPSNSCIKWPPVRRLCRILHHTYCLRSWVVQHCLFSNRDC